MKKLLILILSITSSYLLFSQDTFSIVAVDTATGEVGSAGASCINGSIIISALHPGKGAIHTQSYWNGTNQNYASLLMDSGHSPQQIIDSLIKNDAQNDNTIRQYGIVDLNNNFPRTAAYTGINCFDEKFHKTGYNYSIQGNILIDSSIIDSIEAGFLNTTGSLDEKLMAALQGANIPGADSRCLADGTSSKSSFLRVAKPADNECYYIDLNVNSVPNGVEPIDSLQNLYESLKDCSKFKSEIYINRDTIDLNFLNGNLTVNNIGDVSSCLSWEMGDGITYDFGSSKSITHNYKNTGEYQITLIAKHMDCIDTSYNSIVVIDDIFSTNFIDQEEKSSISIFPNPSNSIITIQLLEKNTYNKIEIITIEGKIISTIPVIKTKTNYTWSSKYREGMFYIRIFGENGVITKKIEIINN